MRTPGVVKFTAVLTVLAIAILGLGGTNAWSNVSTFISQLTDPLVSAAEAEERMREDLTIDYDEYRLREDPLWPTEILWVSGDSEPSSDEARLAANSAAAGFQFNDGVTFPFEEKRSFFNDDWDLPAMVEQVYYEGAHNATFLYMNLDAFSRLSATSTETFGDWNAWMAEFVRLSDENGLDYWYAYSVDEFNPSVRRYYMNESYKYYYTCWRIFCKRLTFTGIETRRTWCHYVLNMTPSPPSGLRLSRATMSMRSRP